jgi:SAM-dependent methyltransferase
MNALVNSLQYWDSRFGSGDWEIVGGRQQTVAFAKAQLAVFGIGRDFGGTILDFGCGLGDAMPVYGSRYQEATLIGADFSAQAIAACRDKYGTIADFVCCDWRSCPSADVIIASNVLEHIQNDLEVADGLKARCGRLFVTVPFREQHLIDEHLRAYDRDHFNVLRPVRSTVFACRGWSQYGLKSLWLEIRAKNLVRPLVGRPLLRRRLQITFEFAGDLAKAEGAWRKARK